MCMFTWMKEEGAGSNTQLSFTKLTGVYNKAK